MKTLGFFLLVAMTLSCNQKAAENKPAFDPLFVSSAAITMVDKEYGEAFEIQPDQTFNRLFIRQVGSEKSRRVPYPTTCTYVEAGKLLAFREILPQERRMDIETHIMIAEIREVSLVNRGPASQDQGDACRRYEADANARTPFFMNTHVEVFNSKKIRLHTSGSGNYKNGGARTSGDLDENFERYPEGFDAWLAVDPESL